jgi:hypothetical protein
MKTVLRVLRWIPRALERAHLEWAIKEVNPLHPDVPYIVQRINELSRGE